MNLTFWGTRGSIPAPGPDTVKYGGNTPSIEINCDETLILLDAGTGIRALGNHLMSRYAGQPIDAHLLVSHFHWDHIQGFPFFVPIYIPNNHITVYGCEGIGVSLEHAFLDLLTPDHFPIDLEQMPSKVDFHQLHDENFVINNVQVKTQYVNHPGMSLGYRIEYGGKSLCYISDNEPQYYLSQHAQNNGNDFKNLLREVEDGKLVFGKMDQTILDFVRGVDLLIHDSQYTLEDYQMKATWGHSFFQFPVELALQANVEKLVLFHHDPMRTDPEVDTIVKACNEIITGRNSNLICEAAFEGMKIEL